jgi:hypothetical protein
MARLFTKDTTHRPVSRKRKPDFLHFRGNFEITNGAEPENIQMGSRRSGAGGCENG